MLLPWALTNRSRAPGLPWPGIGGVVDVIGAIGHPEIRCGDGERAVEIPTPAANHDIPDISSRICNTPEIAEGSGRPSGPRCAQPSQSLCKFAHVASARRNVWNVLVRSWVTDETVASWSGRLDEDGPGALVQSTVPVNRFPDFVATMVTKLKRLFPAMGRRRIAAFLARAGLHLAPTTVRRMLNRAPATEPPAPVAPAESPDEPLASAKPRTVIANYPNHVWGVDSTAVPTSAGFWTSWFPFSLAQSWPFCWWVAVVIDHWSRRSLGLAAFKRRPTADEICVVLDEAARRAGRVPKYTVSDQGSEFSEEYLEWCDDHDVRARFGAIGQHGSIAVEERFIRTLKEEGIAHELVPLHHRAFCASLARLEDWYNEVRPHSSLGGATPDEVFRRRRPANRRRRFEPRARYPGRGACAAPWVQARTKIGARLDLVATPFRGAPHLAQVEIRPAN
jgi:putative transposase